MIAQDSVLVKYQYEVGGRSYHICVLISVLVVKDLAVCSSTGALSYLPQALCH